MNQLGISHKDRPVVEAALKRAEDTKGPAVALQLKNGKIVTEKHHPCLARLRLFY